MVPYFPYTRLPRVFLPARLASHYQRERERERSVAARGMSDPPQLLGHHTDIAPPGLDPSVSWALDPSLAQPSLAEALQSEAEQDDSLSDFWAAQGQSMESLTEESLARTATVSLSRTSTRLNKRAPQRRPAVQENTEVLASYSPQILIDHLMSGPLRNDPLTSDSPPERLSFWGAVVFVDVSGFTKLSEALSKEHGAVVGAELLNEYINSFFEQLIDVVLASGGDIIKFAGDAMQVIWRVPETITSERAGTRVEPPNQFLYGLEIAGLPELVLQAARCCLAMLTKFHGFTPTKGVSLALHMGIGAGFINGFIVGSVQNKWEFFIAGEPIEQMSEAGEIATSGELALSTRATQALMTALEAAALESRPSCQIRKLNRHDRKRYEALAALDGKLRKGRWEKNGSGHDFYMIVGHSSSLLETLLRSDPVAWVLRPFELSPALSPAEANRSSAALEYQPSFFPLPSFLFRRVAAALGAVAGAMGRPERASSDPGASGARSALSASEVDESLASTYPGSPTTYPGPLARASEASLEGLGEDSGRGEREGLGEDSGDGETPSLGSPSRRGLLREATFSDSLISPGREVAFSASLQASRQPASASRARPPSSAASLRRAPTSSKGWLVGGEAAARPKPQRTRSWIVRKAAPRSSDALSTAAAELVAQQQQRRRERLELLLRSFVPALVEERVEAGARDGWLSESRKLVSVFIKIAGLGPRLCEVSSLRTLHAAVKVVQTTIYRYGGQVLRLICDDKGVRFLVGFGMPGRHHEDDESRAVVASVELGKLLPELPHCDQQRSGQRGLIPAIGITSGTVFCGEAGSIRRREYTLAGARVNLAARLMSHAAKRAETEGLAGCVVVSQEVRDAVNVSLERSPELAQVS